MRGVANGEQADRLLTRENFSLMVLDPDAAGEDGLSICRRLREAGNQIPVLMLTAKGTKWIASSVWRWGPTIICPSRSTP